MKASEMMKGRWKRTVLAVVLAAGLMVPGGLVASAATPEDGTDFTEEVLDTDAEPVEGDETVEEDADAAEVEPVPETEVDGADDTDQDDDDAEGLDEEEAEDETDDVPTGENATTVLSDIANEPVDNRAKGDALTSEGGPQGDQIAAEPHAEETCTVTFGDYGSVSVPKGGTLTADHIPQPPATMHCYIDDGLGGGEVEASFYGWIYGSVVAKGEDYRYVLDHPRDDKATLAGFSLQDGSQRFVTWSNFLVEVDTSDLPFSPSDSVQGNETLVAVYVIKGSMVDIRVFKTREGAHSTTDVFSVQMPDDASANTIEERIQNAAKSQITAYNKIWDGQDYAGRWICEGFYLGSKEGGSRPYDFSELPTPAGSEGVWLRLNFVSETCTVYIGGWWPVDDPYLIEGSGRPDRWEVEKGSTIAQSTFVKGELDQFVSRVKSNNPSARFLGWVEIPVDVELGGNLKWMAENLTANTPRYDFDAPVEGDVALVSLWETRAQPLEAPVAPSDSALSPALGFHVVGSAGVTIRGHLSGPNIPDGADVKITADKVASGNAFDLLRLAVGTKLFGGVFEVDLTVNGKLVHDGFGSLTISFPVPDNLKGASKVRVWHLHEDGRITWEDVAPKDGAATVTVTDLSTFALSAADEEDVPPAAPKGKPTKSVPETGADANLAQTGDDAGAGVLPAAFACAIALAAAAAARRRIAGLR